MLNLFQNSSLSSFATLTNTTNKPLFGKPENKGLVFNRPHKPLFGINTIRSDENEDGAVGE